MTFPGEKVFQGIHPIKYVFQPSRQKSEYMIIMFSGFPKEGKGPGYQYIQTLQNVDHNKLFILDDHNKNHVSGMTYYLGFNRDHSVEKSVVELIAKISEERKIKKENIITAGSSKGGYAALYFGFKYGYGHVISGGGQTLLGMFLIDQHKGTDKESIHEDIAGKYDDNKEYLDNLLYDVTRNATIAPNLNIHVGKGDRHYWRHLMPYIEVLKEKGFSYNFDLADYQSHAELTIHFPEYLTRTIEQIIEIQDEIIL